MVDAQPDTGRNTSFVNGAYAQSPQGAFRSVQQGAGKDGFRPTSTLLENNVRSAPNGMSARDRARQPLGGPAAPGSYNGQSDTTFQSRLWLGSAPRTFGG